MRLNSFFCCLDWGTGEGAGGRNRMIILNVAQFRIEEAQTQDALTESEQVRNHPISQCIFLLQFAFSLLLTQCKPSWSWRVTALPAAWPDAAHTGISTLGRVRLVFGFWV